MDTLLICVAFLVTLNVVDLIMRKEAAHGRSQRQAR
jgi:hypothetical protein